MSQLDYVLKLLSQIVYNVRYNNKKFNSTSRDTVGERGSLLDYCSSHLAIVQATSVAVGDERSLQYTKATILLGQLARIAVLALAKVNYCPHHADPLFFFQGRPPFSHY